MREIAAALRLPVVSDVCGGLRLSTGPKTRAGSNSDCDHDHDHDVAHFTNAVLCSPAARARMRPAAVLQFGPRVTSRDVKAWVSDAAGAESGDEAYAAFKHVLVARGERRHDDGGTVTHRVCGDIRSVWHAIMACSCTPPSPFSSPSSLSSSSYSLSSAAPCASSLSPVAIAAPPATHPPDAVRPQHFRATLLRLSAAVGALLAKADAGGRDRKRKGRRRRWTAKRKRRATSIGRTRWYSHRARRKQRQRRYLRNATHRQTRARLHPAVRHAARRTLRRGVRVVRRALSAGAHGAAA